jgi:hypothetical protein
MAVPIIEHLHNVRECYLHIRIVLDLEWILPFGVDPIGPCLRPKALPSYSPKRREGITDQFKDCRASLCDGVHDVDLSPMLAPKPMRPRCCS